jgi:hypothetical protein
MRSRFARARALASVLALSAPPPSAAPIVVFSALTAIG